MYPAISRICQSLRDLPTTRSMKGTIDYRYTAYAAICLWAVNPIGTLAATRGMAGTFERRSPKAESVQVERDERGFHVDIAVSTSSCDGHIVGQGTVTGNREITLRSLPEYAGQTICSVRMTYGKASIAIDLEETTCSYFHGTACRFDGHVTRMIAH